MYLALRSNILLCLYFHFNLLFFSAVESEVTLMLVRGEEGGNAINKLNRLIGPIIPEEKDPEEENPEGDEANKEGEENQDAENPEGSVNTCTVEARLSGHRFSGKPRFKGHTCDHFFYFFSR